MMFVGDSLNRGQYVSFVCLLHKLIPDDEKSMETFDSLTVFTAKVKHLNSNKHFEIFLILALYLCFLFLVIDLMC